MRLTAYVLAADPAWVQLSVQSYYHLVEDIVVSYDVNGVGWTGAPIPVDECISRLKAIDSEGKMRFVPGDYARPGRHPMENDTYQRQCAFDVASEGADWVLAIDTDEVVPNADAVLAGIRDATERDLPQLEWPMRVLFHRLPDGRFLEVCAPGRLERFEYPGPIAARPGVKFLGARQSGEKFLRPVVAGDNRSPQIGATPGSQEIRVEGLASEFAILHFSWARSTEDVRSKVASWSHNEGFRSWFFYHVCWKSAPYSWRWLRNFHPFNGQLWPRLKPTRLSLSGKDI